MRRGGFSLIEISVVLVVVATMLAGVLPAITESQKTRAQDETIKRIEAIEEAILTFRVAEDRIPCPSDNTRGLTTAAFGREADTKGTCTGGTIAANEAPAGGTVIGGVPTKTLGLPDEYAFDGWGRRFTYLVDQDLTDDADFGSATAGSIEVRDASGAARSGTDTSGAAMAIISHGPNGHGAYTRAGTRNSFGTTNADELQNCNCTSTAAAGTSNHILVQKMATPDPASVLGNYDDVVRYKLRSQLDLLIGGGGTTPTCPAGYTMNGSSCYKYVSTPTANWANARIACQTEGADLVVINDAAENTFVKTLFNPSSDRVWMGITDAATEGTWLTGAGAPAPFFDWPAGQPDNSGPTFNEDCGHFFEAVAGQWNDIDCPNTLKYVCEKGASTGGGAAALTLWEDVPLVDTNPFDMNCRYRFKSPIASTFMGTNPWFYTTGTAPDQITWVSHSGATSHIASGTKASYRVNGGAVQTVTQLQKNCSAGPSGASALWTESGSNIYNTNTTTGNVGVRTSTPLAPLHVNGDWIGSPVGQGALNIQGDKPTIRFSSDDAAFSGNQQWLLHLGLNGPTPGNIEFHNGGTTGVTWTPRFSITPAGNVGIGTTTPQAKLDVAGEVRIGSTAVACTVANAGAMRYTAGSVQFCNGSAWAAMGGGGVLQGTLCGWTDFGNAVVAATCGGLNPASSCPAGYSIVYPSIGGGNGASCAKN